MTRALLVVVTLCAVAPGCDAMKRYTDDPLRDQRSIQPHELPLRSVPDGIVPTDPRGRGRGGLRHIAEVEPAANLAEAKLLTNPLEATRANLEAGELSYSRYCSHCHGDQGRGWTSVGSSLDPRPPDLVPRVAGMTDGEIFGAVSFGGGRLPPALAATISVDDRWRIIHYLRRELPRVRDSSSPNWDQPVLAR